MLRASTLLVAGLVLATGCWFVQAQDSDTRALVLKAIKAHGGKELLAKHKATEVKFKGDVDVMGMQAKFSGEVSFLLPDKMRNAFTISVNNMDIEVVQVFDGKRLYVKAAGQSLEIDDNKLIDEVKDALYVEKVASLLDLDDKAYKLNALGEVKVNDKGAIGVRVSRDGKRDVNLYFDKDTNLLVKYEFRGKNPFDMMEATEEKIVSDYKDVMGIKTAMKMVVLYDGKKAMDLVVSDVRYAETLEDSVFAKP